MSLFLLSLVFAARIVPALVFLLLSALVLWRARRDERRRTRGTYLVYYAAARARKAGRRG